MFQRLDLVSIFRKNLFSWAHSIELVPISYPVSETFSKINMMMFLDKDRMMDNVHKYDI
jgi:hypothetical protein